jgi:hypothetical protein
LPKFAFILAFDFWINAWHGGIKWPILYHQALIQKSNAKIKASLSQNV